MIVFDAIIGKKLRGIGIDEVTSRQAYTRRRDAAKTARLYAIVAAHVMSSDQELGKIRNDQRLGQKVGEAFPKTAVFRRLHMASQIHQLKSLRKGEAAKHT